jgi:hypothetical protein
VPVIVGHHCFSEVTGANFLSTDDERNVGAIGRHCFQAIFQRCSLGAAGCVAFYRLVNRKRNTAVAVESR